MNIKILPPDIQESEFTTRSNRWQLNRREYLNYDQKVTKVSGYNRDTLEFGGIKFRLKLFTQIVNPLNNALGISLIIEILEGFYWKGHLKKDALKNLKVVKS